MELTFLGRGSAFNYNEKNTSAYFIENNELFLIDCGETVFASLMDNNILDGIDKINILITHTHSDHIGSLGTLISYVYFVLKKRINFIISEDIKQIVNIEQVLQNFGCPNDSFTYMLENDLDKKYKSFNSIRFIKTDHSKEIPCYSLIFRTNKGLIYYSGDTKDLHAIKEIIATGTEIDKLYIDVTDDPASSNVHINIDVLNSIIPYTIKSKTYCMHFNSALCIIKAQNYGFNTVEVPPINKEYRLK